MAWRRTGNKPLHELDGLNHWRIYAALGGDELKKYSTLMQIIIKHDIHAIWYSIFLSSEHRMFQCKFNAFDTMVNDLALILY